MIFDSQNRQFRRTQGHRLLKALKPCVERPPLVAPTDFQGQSSLGASSRWRRGRSECGREDRRLEPAPTMDPAGRTRGSAHVGGSSCSRPGRSPRCREDRRLQRAIDPDEAQGVAKIAGWSRLRQRAIDPDEAAGVAKIAGWSRLRQRTIHNANAIGIAPIAYNKAVTLSL